MLKFSQILDGQKIFENGFRALSPKVSVVMPTYCRNAEGMLVDCIESVLNQTYKDFEFIIVDDGSSDGSQQVIETFADRDPRIVYVRHDINSGLPAVRTNEGILIARAPLIAFIFDDNLWRPNALQILVNAIQETSVEMVFGDVELNSPQQTLKRLGCFPITIEILLLINVIANGGVLCKRIFFEKYGLYDPHLIMRRVCDWDLWTRAVKLGAIIQHIKATVGIEHGPVSPVSLGNTVHLDFKLYTAYAIDDRNLVKRVASLLPQTINEYDILDPEKVMPYVRDFKEWEEIELNIYQPFLDHHPEYQYEPPIRHNRRYDPGLNGYALNPPMPVFKNRKRVLLLGHRFNRTMKDWHDALSSDPNIILVTSTDFAISLFSTEDFDCLILFDCCHGVDHKINDFQKHGTCVIFVVDHGLDEKRVEGDPIQLLHLKNYTSADAFVMDTYFPINGNPWPSSAKQNTTDMMELSDQVFSIQPERENSHPIKFIPNSINDAMQVVENWPEDVALYLGDLENINTDHIKTLADNLRTRNGVLYFLEGSSLPTKWKSLFPGWRIRVINDSVFTLVEKAESTCFIVPDVVLANVSEYERLLLYEDQVRQKNLVIPISRMQSNFDAQTYQTMWLDLADQWNKLAIGNREDERLLYIRNLVSGVALRKKNADMHGKSRARDVRTVVFINSLLFGGSEAYGLTLSEKLRDLGFDITVAGPINDVYKSGTGKINDWLNMHHFPPLVQTEYGSASYHLFDQEPAKEEVIRSSNKLGKWLEVQNIDIVFCSGFIPEPSIAEDPKRIVFMALFPPWGYNLANMTFLKNRISGLFSDTRWGLDLWMNWFPTPSEVTPSLVDQEYFKILNKNLPRQPVCLAIMGTVVQTKRHKEALLAVRQLILEGYDLRLNIYGHLLEVYKTYIDELMELVNDPLLIGRVKFHDFVEDSHQVARENHVILSTSLAEGLPQALIFNQASGLLPVACPAGGVSEVVIDGETGFLADGFEVGHIVNALRRALHKQDDWQKLINNGRKFLLNTCTESEFMRRTLKVMTTGTNIRSSQGFQLFKNYGIENLKLASIETAIPYTGLQIGPSLSKKNLMYLVQVNSNALKGLSFQPGTYSTRPQGEMELTIFLDKHTEPLRKVKLDLGVLRDNQWAQVTFEPIMHSAGLKFRLEVEADVKEGIVALYESSPVNQRRWDILRLRIERRLHRYIKLPYNRSSSAFFPFYK